MILDKQAKFSSKLVAFQLKKMEQKKELRKQEKERFIVFSLIRLSFSQGTGGLPLAP